VAKAIGPLFSTILYTLTVTNLAGDTATANVTVNVNQVSISDITPANPDVTVNLTKQFSATVTGASDLTVDWSVVNGTGSGTIDASGLFSATGIGDVTITAASHADPTKFKTTVAHVHDYCFSSQCFAVPPTGQTKCYNDTVEIVCPSNRTDPFWGQDAQFPKARTLTCSGGACLTTAAAVDEVITDSLTGFVWQRTFVFDKTWQQAMDYCDTLNYGGHEDWRLPNPFELESIVDNQRFNPSIDITLFPGTSYASWTSPSYVLNADYAWLVTFTTSIVYYYPKTYGYHTRCVRGGAESGDTSRYVVTEPVSGQQVVKDVNTGLMWQGNYSTGKNWQQALNYCATLSHGGFSDWRLPNKNELMSLVNYSRNSPASDFPGIPSSYFNSSSSNTENPDKAWGVSFNYGPVGCDPKTNTFSARCVRDPRCGPSPTGKGGDMCDVPAGVFHMGCNSAVDSECQSNENPYHDVTTGAYKIDKYEVTVSQYAACNAASPSTCTAPKTGSGYNWGVSGRENHPINGVDWNQSKAYCAWAGKRLPSEAEWEKAARGPDGLKYPWGNTGLDCDHAVMSVSPCSNSNTAQVGSKPLGVSPYGAMDMIGNVYEWVEDDYHGTYNGAPTNGSAWVDSPRGSDRVLHGGGWRDYYAYSYYLRASYRYGFSPIYKDDIRGFRCAM
jgi:formylglycine-generating enzyme required for sulfatase activity